VYIIFHSRRRSVSASSDKNEAYGTTGSLDCRNEDLDKLENSIAYFTSNK